MNFRFTAAGVGFFRTAFDGFKQLAFHLANVGNLKFFSMKFMPAFFGVDKSGCTFFS